MMSIFCKHKWETHAKDRCELTKHFVVEDTKSWYYPKLDSKTVIETTEILICQKCGKIKKITY